MERTDLLAADLQSSEPEVRIGLSRAGVRGVNKAIRLRRGTHEKLVFAEISCSVDLDPEQRGVHMSRFPELFEQAIDELVIGEALLVEELAEHIAAGGRRAPGGAPRRGRGDRALPDPARDAGDEDEDAGDGLADRDRRRIADRDTAASIGVEATGINACPCAQGLVRGKRVRATARGRLRRRRRRDASSSSSRSPRTTSAGAERSTSAPTRRSTPRIWSTSSSGR